MGKYLTRMFVSLLDLWGVLLVNWAVKSKDEHAFLPENETHFSLLIEN
jgi:hypothetical protein